MRPGNRSAFVGWQRGALALAALLLLFVPGCSGRTGVVVALYTDLPPGALERVVLRATMAGQVFSNESRPWRLVGTGADRLPGSLILLAGEQLGAMEIVVEGHAAGEASPRLVRRARVLPVRGELLLVRLALSSACDPEVAPSCAGTDGCASGQCAPLEVDGACLEPYEDGAEQRLRCQPSPALLDTRSGDPVPVAGEGCARGEVCIEGCCLRDQRDGGPDDRPDVPAPDLPPDVVEPPDAPLTPDAPDLAPTPDVPPPVDAVDLPDAPGPDVPAGCPDRCDSCLEDGTCVFSCGSGECNGEIVCPRDRPCQVNCVGDTACESGHIDCTLATSCDISCIGTDACDTGGIDCAGERCSVVCLGTSACEESQINCNARVCDIRCDGANACAAGVCCNGGDCDGSCTSLFPGSCTCR